MLHHTLLCVATLAFGVALANENANLFMDDIITDIRSFGLIEDPLQLPESELSVKVNGVIANNTEVFVYGLSRIRREGDCSYQLINRTLFAPRSVAKMHCPVSLRAMRILMNADVYTSYFVGGSRISTNSTIVSGMRGVVAIQGKLFTEGKLNGISVRPVVKTELIRSNISPSDLAELIEKINLEMSDKLIYVLEVHFTGALHKLLSTRTLPPVM